MGEPRLPSLRSLVEGRARSDILKGMGNDSLAHLDLRAVARQAVIEAGFAPDLPNAVEREVDALDDSRASLAADSSARDLRSLLWSSIDNLESRDLDQVEYVERQTDGDIRVMVGIADVDAFVPAGSATDQHAAENATSVYTGVETFPMLPERLSTDITSLLGGVERLAVVIEMTVSPTGDVRSSDIYRARIHNYAKLDYESVGDWLEGRGTLPSAAASVQGMEEQLRLQSEAADRLRALPLAAWGILPPDASPAELQAAIHTLAQGLVVLPTAVIEPLLRQRGPIAALAQPPAEPLTAREREVLELLAIGSSNKLIARELQVSEHTVKFHISSIFAKLGAASRTEAISRGARQGLITL